MTKKLSLPCNFGGKQQNVDFYVGEPKLELHPIQNQSKWLSSEKGGSVLPEVMDSLLRIKKIAQENNVPFSEICAYAIESAQTDKVTAGGGGTQKN